MKTENPRTVALAEIINLPIFPYADLLPMLKDTYGKDEPRSTMTLAELADSILQNGLYDPIVLWTDEDGVTWLLDGRNRRAACEKAARVTKKDIREFSVDVEAFVGSWDEAKVFVKAKTDRRDMTASQRAHTAVGWWELEATEAETRKSPGTNQYTKCLPPNLAATTKWGDTRDILAKDWRVSHTYIQDVYNLKKKEEADRAASKAAFEEAERQRELEEKANAELEAAKAADDDLRARDAAARAHQAAIAREDAREKAAAKAEEADKKQNTLNQLASGKKNMNQVRKDNVGQEISVDDPVTKAKSRLNKILNDLFHEFTDNARTLLDYGGDAGQEFVRQKMIKLDEFMANVNKRFGDLESVDNLLDPEENRDYWSSIEARNRG